MGRVRSVVPVTYVSPEYFQRALSWKVPRYASHIVGADGLARQFGHVEREGGGPTFIGNVSPDGKWIISAKSFEPDQRPASWAQYAITDERAMDVQFYLFNAASLQGRSLLDAPLGWAILNYTNYEVLWFPDSSKVILVNTLMPLNERDESSRDTSYIVEYDLASSVASIIAPLPRPASGSSLPPTAKVRWLKPGREVLVEYKEGVTQRRIKYARQKNGWVKSELTEQAVRETGAATDGPALWRGLKVQIRQGMNEPPRLVASLNGKELLLTPADPALAGVKRLPVEKVDWKDARGKPWSGALLLPESGARASKLPLIIQLGDVNFDQFSPDGVVLRPGHSAQVFAARGFAVLTFREERESEVPSTVVDELPLFQGGVDAAVRMLEGRGLIDPSKVGLIGHSRLGFRSFYIATHPKGFVPAAVVVQDSFSGGFSEYVLGLALSPKLAAEAFEKLYSDKAQPFWLNKSGWMDNSPRLSLENMASPLLLTTSSDALSGPPVPGMVGFMDAYGGLRRLGKPIEAVSFPGGTHNPMQPAHRAVNMDLVIDWMEFWILGKESPDVADSERNVRWRSMRQRWASGQHAQGNVHE